MSANQREIQSADKTGVQREEENPSGNEDKMQQSRMKQDLGLFQLRKLQAKKSTVPTR
jgi:hypothetical protein